MLRVFGAVEKCYTPPVGVTRQFLKLYPAAVELSPLFLFKLRPLARIMPKRFSQGRAGRDLLQPLINLRLLFRQSSWPKAINQDTIAIGFGTLIINAFDSHAHARLSQQRLHLVVANQAQLEI